MTLRKTLCVSALVFGLSSPVFSGQLCTPAFTYVDECKVTNVGKKPRTVDIRILDYQGEIIENGKVKSSKTVVGHTASP
jgi:hypothetical protein